MMTPKQGSSRKNNIVFDHCSVFTFRIVFFWFVCSVDYLFWFLIGVCLLLLLDCMLLDFLLNYTNGFYIIDSRLFITEYFAFQESSGAATTSGVSFVSGRDANRLPPTTIQTINEQLLTADLWTYTPVNHKFDSSTETCKGFSLEKD